MTMKTIPKDEHRPNMLSGRSPPRIYMDDRSNDRITQTENVAGARRGHSNTSGADPTSPSGIGRDC